MSNAVETANLYTRLAACFPENGGKTFAHLPDGRAFTYDDVRAASARYANLLVKLGVKPGDRVAVQAPKSIDALMLYLGAVRAGAVFLPLNTAYTPAEVAYFLGDAEPVVFACDPADAEALAPAAEEVGARLETLGASRPSGEAGDAAATAGTLPAKALEEPSDFADAPRASDDLAAILYTSGTTGRSKGAMLSQENLWSNAETLRSFWRFTADDTLLHALPIFHTHGLFVAVNVTLAAGGSLIFLPKFDVDQVLAVLPQATAMMGVPTFYTRLLADPRLDRPAAAHMRLFVSGSAPLLAETHLAFEERTGHRILERYGMTETNMNTSNPYEGDRRAGTVGHPLPGVDLKICDPETGAELDDGEIGVIEVRGPNVFKGYWRMPEKTAEELRPNGFFITGDLGRIDERGYVVIVGRAKDLIISGGLNIYPKEIETVIDALPGVAESAVVAAPHSDFGEAVVAYVTLAAPGATDASVIADGVAQKLARFKHPKRIIIIDDLPRNAMGKVEKKRLREDCAAFFT